MARAYKITAPDNFEYGCTEPFERTRKRLIKTAKELCYPPAVVTRLEEAKTRTEMSNIMVDARHGVYK